jgi:hypothetical protein
LAKDKAARPMEPVEPKIESLTRLSGQGSLAAFGLPRPPKAGSLDFGGFLALAVTIFSLAAGGF